MTTKARISPDFNLGSRVRIKNYSGPIGKIVELRGPLGPGGIHIYRVAIPQNPGVSLVELRRDQLELLAAMPRKILPSKLRRICRKKRISRGPNSPD